MGAPTGRGRIDHVAGARPHEHRHVLGADAAGREGGFGEGHLAQGSGLLGLVLHVAGVGLGLGADPRGRRGMPLDAVLAGGVERTEDQRLGRRHHPLRRHDLFERVAQHRPGSARPRMGEHLCGGVAQDGQRREPGITRGLAAHLVRLQLDH